MIKEKKEGRMERNCIEKEKTERLKEEEGKK